jgi:hypothetical protein
MSTKEPLATAVGDAAAISGILAKHVLLTTLLSCFSGSCCTTAPSWTWVRQSDISNGVIIVLKVVNRRYLHMRPPPLSNQVGLLWTRHSWRFGIPTSYH